MYAVIVRYKAPIAEVKRRLSAHKVWLKAHHEAGHLLLHGEQRGGKGGFLLIQEMPREDLDAILATDPYASYRVASYEVIDVAARGAQEAFTSLIRTE